MTVDGAHRKHLRNEKKVNQNRSVERFIEILFYSLRIELAINEKFNDLRQGWSKLKLYQKLYSKYL